MLPIKDSFINNVLILITPVALLVSLNATCLAYFNSMTDIHYKQTITLRSELLPPSSSNYLVWIDNSDRIHHFSSDSYSSQKYASNYLYAFYMPLIEIMIQPKITHAPLEFSIENLLYANLKIERLLDEYNNLKNRSESILEGLDVPYITQQNKFDPGFKGLDLTIPNQLDNVNKRLEILAGPIPSGYNTKERIYQPGFRTNHQSKASVQLNGLKEADNQPYRTIIGKPQRYINDDGIETGQEAGHLDNENYGSGQFDRLPFAERIVRSLFEHLKKNKIELLLYLLILFGFYRVLFGRPKI